MAQSLRALMLILGLGSFLPSAASAQGPHAVGASRIFEALGVGRGGTLCEIGAGEGELSLAAADQVGSQGHVYTSELGADRVKTLRRKVGDTERPQIHVTAGDAERTNFPDGACDGLFMRNVYHHFATPAAMNASIAAALKPGGRLAVVDFTPPGAEASTPADRDEDGSHGVTPASLERELKAAGFQAVTTAVAPPARGPDRWFMVVGTKPAT